MDLFSGVVNQISFGVFNIFWYICGWLPLQIIRTVISLFKLMGFDLVRKILFKNENFHFHELPLGYLALIIVGTLSFFILIILIFIKYFYNVEKVVEDNAIKRLFKRVIPAFATMFVIPVVTFVLVIVLQVFLEATLLALSSEQELTKTLFRVLKPDNNAISDYEWEQIANKNFTFVFDTYKKFEWGEGIKLIIFSTILTVLLAWLILTSLYIVTIKVVEIFYLFIGFPLASVFSVYDDGAILKEWNKAFIAKFVMIYTYQVILNLFIIWAGIAMTIVQETNQDDWNSFTKMIYNAVLVSAGMIAIKSFTAHLAQVLGTENAHREATNFASSASKLAMGAMGAGLAFGKMASGGAKKALGIGASPKAKELKNAFANGLISKKEYKDQKAKMREEAKGLGFGDTRDRGLVSSLTDASRNHKLNKYDKQLEKINAIKDKSANNSPLSSREQKLLNKEQKIQTNKQNIEAKKKRKEDFINNHWLSSKKGGK